jgi:hypothetical protein
MEGTFLTISLRPPLPFSSKVLPKVKTYLLENADADVTKVVDFYPPKELLELIKVQLPTQASSKETVRTLCNPPFGSLVLFTSTASLESSHFYLLFVRVERADRNSRDGQRKRHPDRLTMSLSLVFPLLSFSFFLTVCDCVCATSCLAMLKPFSLSIVNGFSGEI